MICSRVLRERGEIYLRTCPVHGLSPCPEPIPEEEGSTEGPLLLSIEEDEVMSLERALEEALYPRVTYVDDHNTMAEEAADIRTTRLQVALEMVRSWYK